MVGLCYPVPLGGCPCFWRVSVQTLVDGEERGLSEPIAHLFLLPTPLRQLVNAGVLTVRDAGSWWLAVPGAGRFIKYFVKGILSAAEALSPSRTPFGGSSDLTHLSLLLCHLSRAPRCPWHGPEGQVPGATPFGASGPAGACCGATWPRLPCA